MAGRHTHRHDTHAIIPAGASSMRRSRDCVTKQAKLPAHIIPEVLVSLRCFRETVLTVNYGGVVVHAMKYLNCLRLVTE
jgi:hypothetical protein